MAKVQKSPAEVEAFLKRVREILKNLDNVVINNRPWAGGRVNKTRAFMAETGIRKSDIAEVLKELRVCNYSYTDDDRNVNFKGQQVWVFGIAWRPVDEDEDIYTKIKVQQMTDTNEDYLRVMSFHPESPTPTEGKLLFPYDDYNEN